jgi:Domain of unknown function (DUF4160)
LSFPADQRSDRESSGPNGGRRQAGFPIGRLAAVGNDKRNAESGDATAKYWLDPVALARSRGFRARDLTRLRAEIIERRHEFLEAWNAHFGGSA